MNTQGITPFQLDSMNFADDMFDGSYNCFMSNLGASQWLEEPKHKKRENSIIKCQHGAVKCEG